MEDLVEIRLAVFDVIVDTLVDLAEAEPHELEDIREMMMTAAEILMDRLGFEVIRSNDDGSFAIKVDIMGDSTDE